jgi:AMIN domain-containing protein
MQTSRETSFGKVRRAIPILSVFDCKTFLSSGILTIVTASAVSLFLLLGLAYASSVPSNSARQKSCRAHEEPVVEPNQTDNTQINKEVREIRVEFAEGGEEKVFFLVNGFYPPRRLALEGDRPRIACDFSGARLGKGIGRCIKVNGRLIQQIRTAFHPGKHPKVRVVVDLVPGKNYVVDQIFYKKDNLYVIIVNEERADH